MFKTIQEQKREAEAARVVKTFNATYPVGSKFRWRSVGKAGVPHETLTVARPAFETYGRAVAFAEEKSGFISVDKEFVDYSFRSTAGAAA